jgi:hypothetical protein
MKTGSRTRKHLAEEELRDPSPWGTEERLIVADVQAYCLETATALSRIQIVNAISPAAVIAVLQNAGISFVLVGAYGISGWTQKPRATRDVDVVVAAKHHKKAIKALLDEFSHLEADDHEAVTRLRDRQTHTVVIDVMKPNQQLYREVFKHTHTVSSEGQTFRVPSLEMALTMKFAPMISLHRADIDKHQDAADFGRMVLANPKIDLEKLALLGDLVYPGGGQEIVEKVRQVRAGEKLTL